MYMEGETEEGCPQMSSRMPTAAPSSIIMCQNFRIQKSWRINADESPMIDKAVISWNASCTTNTRKTVPNIVRAILNYIETF